MDHFKLLNTHVTRRLSPIASNIVAAIGLPENNKKTRKIKDQILSQSIEELIEETINPTCFIKLDNVERELYTKEQLNWFLYRVLYVAIKLKPQN